MIRFKPPIALWAIGIALFCVEFSFAILLGMHPVNGLAGFALLIVTSGHASLLGMWTVLGQGRSSVRALVAMAMTAVTAFVIAMHNGDPRHGEAFAGVLGPSAITIQNQPAVLFANVAVPLVVYLLFGIAGGKFLHDRGMALTNVNQVACPRVETDPRIMQFSLFNLFEWTTVAAVAAAFLARLVVFSSFVTLAFSLVNALIILPINCAIAVVVLYYGRLPFARWWLLVMAFSAFFPAVGLTVGAYLTFVAIILMVARAGGYRLLRHDQYAPPPPPRNDAAPLSPRDIEYPPELRAPFNSIGLH